MSRGPRPVERLAVRRDVRDASGQIDDAPAGEPLQLHKLAKQLSQSGIRGRPAPRRCPTDADDLELWWVWEKASHGRRQLTWSRDLRTWAGLHRERTNEEIAAENRGGEPVLVLPRETWEVVRYEVADLLDAVELGGAPAGERWLRSRRLRYSVPEQTTTG